MTMNEFQKCGGFDVMKNSSMYVWKMECNIGSTHLTFMPNPEATDNSAVIEILIKRFLASCFSTGRQLGELSVEIEAGSRAFDLINSFSGNFILPDADG